MIGFGEAEGIPGVKEDGTGQDQVMFGMLAAGTIQTEDTGGAAVTGNS